jgi:putative ABC transport system permease protein
MTSVSGSWHRRTRGDRLAGARHLRTASYTVTQRTHEIGIRLAIGAQRGAIVRQFVRMGLRLGSGGAAIGIALALAGTRLMASLLFGVSATDALSFALAAGAVLLVALLSSLISAYRCSLGGGG